MEGQKEKKPTTKRRSSRGSKKMGKLESAPPNPEKDRIIAEEMAAAQPVLGESPPKSDPIPIPQPHADPAVRIFWIVISNGRKIGVHATDKKKAWMKCIEMCKDPAIGGVGVKPVSMH